MIHWRKLPKSIIEGDDFSFLSQPARELRLVIIPYMNSHGKMMGNPYTLKGMLFPKIDWWTPAKIERYMREISEKTPVKWFSDHMGVKYVHDLSFQDHQNVRKDKKGKDTFPSFQQVALNSDGPTTGLRPSCDGPTTVVRRPTEERGESLDKTKNFRPNRASFDFFWKAYPKKKSKAQATKAWAKLRVDDQLFDEIMAGLGRAKLFDKRFKDPDYTPHPSTWLNARGWEDEPDPAKAPPVGIKERLRHLRPPGGLLSGSVVVDVEVDGEVQ